MKKIEEIGTCPICESILFLYKTSNYKRFVKCEACGISYPVPKRGKIEISGLNCPKSNMPLLIIEKKEGKSYFWAAEPCFNCLTRSSCESVQLLIKEFEELNIHGY